MGLSAFATSTVVLVALSLAPAALADGLDDSSFEAQGTALNIRVGRLGPAGERWGAGWTPTPSSASEMRPDSGVWWGGTLSRSEDYAWGWKVTPAGEFFAVIKDRGSLSQRFSVEEEMTVALVWIDANRASWKDVDWFGRPNSYAVTLTDVDGKVLELGTFQSEVAGGNSFSTPPGNGWGTTEGKRTWFSRAVGPVTLTKGLFTLRFSSLSPFYALVDGGMGVDDRSTLLDDIRFVPFDGGLDGGLDGGSEDGGLEDGGIEDGGIEDAGSDDDAGIDRPLRPMNYRVGCGCGSVDLVGAWFGMVLLVSARGRRLRAATERSRTRAGPAGTG